jgi:hypothetical protein
MPHPKRDFQAASYPVRLNIFELQFIRERAAGAYAEDGAPQYELFQLHAKASYALTRIANAPPITPDLPERLD